MLIGKISARLRRLGATKSMTALGKSYVLCIADLFDRGILQAHPLHLMPPEHRSLVLETGERKVDDAELYRRLNGTVEPSSSSSPPSPFTIYLDETQLKRLQLTTLLHEAMHVIRSDIQQDPNTLEWILSSENSVRTNEIMTREEVLCFFVQQYCNPQPRVRDAAFRWAVREVQKNSEYSADFEPEGVPTAAWCRETIRGVVAFVGGWGGGGGGLKHDCNKL